MGRGRFYAESPRMQRLPAGHFKRLAKGDECPVYDLLCACTCCQPAREYELIELSPRGPPPSLRLRPAVHRSRSSHKPAKAYKPPHSPQASSPAPTRSNSAATDDDAAAESERRGDERPADMGGALGPAGHSRSGSSFVPEVADAAPPHHSPSVTPRDGTPRIGSVHAAPTAAAAVSQRSSSKVDDTVRPRASSGDPNKLFQKKSKRKSKEPQESQPAAGVDRSSTLEKRQRSSRELLRDSSSRQQQRQLEKRSSGSSSIEHVQRRVSGGSAAGPEGRPAHISHSTAPTAAKVVIEVASLNGSFKVAGRRVEVLLLCGYLNQSLAELLNHTRNRSALTPLGPAEQESGVYEVSLPLSHRFVLPLSPEGLGLRVTVVVTREVDELQEGGKKISWKLNDLGAVAMPLKDLLSPSVQGWTDLPLSMSPGFSACSASLRCKFSSYDEDQGPPIPEDSIEPFKPPANVSSVRTVRVDAKHASETPMALQHQDSAAVWHSRDMSAWSPASSISSRRRFKQCSRRAPHDSTPPQRLGSELQLNSTASRSLLRRQQSGSSSVSSSSSRSSLSGFGSSNEGSSAAAEAAVAAAVYETEEGYVVDGRALLRPSSTLDCQMSASGQLEHKWKQQHRQASLRLQQLLQHAAPEQQQQQVMYRADTPLSSSSRSSRSSASFQPPTMPRKSSLSLRTTPVFSGYRGQQQRLNAFAAKKVNFTSTPRCHASLPLRLSSSVSSGSSSGHSGMLLDAYEGKTSGGSCDSLVTLNDTPRSSSSSISVSSSNSTISSSSSNGGNGARLLRVKAICPPSKKTASSQPQQQQQQQQQQRQVAPRSKTVQELSKTMEDMLKGVKANTLRMQRRMQQQPPQQQQQPVKEALPLVPKAREQQQAQALSRAPKKTRSLWVRVSEA